MSKVLIPVDCCVNDDHGCLADRIVAIHFPGLELDSIDMRGPTFRQLPATLRGEERIRIGRHEYAARHLCSHVGNIFWERYGMAPETAAWCLHVLRRSQGFTFDAGFGELGDWWETSIQAEAHVARLLVDAAREERL